MKKVKVIISAVLIFCLMTTMAGCSSNHNSNSLKDNLLDGWNNWMQSFSRHALTKDKNLQGDREKGVDEYTGSYTAEYSDFNGEEYIFGGTALERNKGSNLKVTYSLEITSGSATLYWATSGEKRTISSETAEDVYNLTLSSGDNYIVLNGEHFIGTLKLTVEDESK